MRITVNGEPRDCPADLRVDALLAALDLAGRPCAVEVNRALVPRRDHASHPLGDGDVVEIVTLVGGG